MDVSFTIDWFWTIFTIFAILGYGITVLTLVGGGSDGNVGFGGGFEIVVGFIIGVATTLILLLMLGGKYLW